MTEPGFIDLTIVFGDQRRRRAARDQCGADDDVGRGDALGDLDLLALAASSAGIGRA